jgi:hypothetical protein
MLSDFFKLNQNAASVKLDDQAALLARFDNADSLNHATIAPGSEIKRKRFRRKVFENVAFSHVALR